MIVLDNITIGYGRKILLRNVSATASAGELTALVGRNGCGKSTLIRILAGLGRPLSGTVNMEGENIAGLSRTEIARRVSFVGTERVRVPNLRCRDLTAMGRAPWTGWSGVLSGYDRMVSDKAMDWVGMREYADRYIDEMSDGEYQKIMIARALAQDTPVMLLDEPTAFLDVPGRHQVAGILKRLASEEGKTIVFSTHDIGIALKKADKIWLADSGRLVSMKTSDPETAGKISSVFGIDGI